MATPPEPIPFPSDYKPTSVEDSIEALTRMFHEVSEDQRRGRIHPKLAHLRRWEIKSAVYRLKQLLPPDSTTAPQAQPATRSTQ